MLGTFPQEPPYSRVLYSYIWCCSFCSETETHAYTGNRGDIPLIPSLPHKWRVIDGRLACQCHQVLLLVDGKVAE